MRAIPRLPAVTATRAPGGSPASASTGASAARAAGHVRDRGTSRVSRISRASKVVILSPYRDDVALRPGEMVAHRVACGIGIAFPTAAAIASWSRAAR